MRLNKKEIEELAEKCGMAQYEANFFEVSVEDLQDFAERVIERYESHNDDTFIAYGKKEDWSEKV
jgi:formyltetrahydrofolate synthetase